MEQTKNIKYSCIFERNHIYYHISCVYELLNDNLISGNSYGLKIYQKKVDKYTLIKTLETDINVEYIIQIKLHLLIIFEKDFTAGYGYGASYYSHLISFYDINKEEETNIIQKIRIFI